MRERKVAWILLRGASVDSLRDGVLTLNFVREGDAKGFAGGGHDRALARVGTPVPTVALLYDSEFFPHVPSGQHDQRVRMIARPSAGVTRLPRE